VPRHLSSTKNLKTGIPEDDREISNTSQESGFYSTGNSSHSVGQVDINQTFPRRRKDATRASVLDLQSFKQLQPIASNSDVSSTSSQQNYFSKSTTISHYTSQSLSTTFLNIKPLYFEVPRASPSPSPLVGRHWLFREMQHHLSSHLPTNKGVIIRGGPGTGKTEVILSLVENSCFGGNGSSPFKGGHSSASVPPGEKNSNLLSNHVVAYHFCQADNAPTCLLPEFVHSIAAQMSQAPQLAPYFQLLQSDPTIQTKLSIANCNVNPSESFVGGILKPLNSLTSSSKLAPTICIIVVDALCEAEQHRPDYGDTLATFLARHLPDFPSWLKIVCTVRSAMVDITRNLPFHQICLDNTDMDERLNKDLADYVSSRVNTSSQITTNIWHKKVSDASMKEKLSNFLIIKAKGCFLYVKLILDFIERGTLNIKSSGFKSLPQTLCEVYHLAFNLLFSSSQSYEHVGDILSIALASLQPVSLSKLFNIFSALFVKPEVKWREFQDRYQLVSDYLITRKDGSLMCFHPTFRDWLVRRREGESTKFLCDIKTGHAAIAYSISRQAKVLKPESVLGLIHHILKANINKSPELDASYTNKDIQAAFLALAIDDVSLALGCTKNIFAPLVKVSRLLLLAGANPNHITDHMNHSPLLGMYAYQGNTEMVSLLLEYGADPNQTNEKGVAPLALAATGGFLDTMKLLVQCGASINTVDEEGVCALVEAAKRGQLVSMEFLVGLDWNVDLMMQQLGVEEALQQALIEAIKNGHYQLSEKLLNLPSIKINCSDTLSGLTPLCAACKGGHKILVETLLRRQATIDALNVADKEAPIHVAAKEGHADILAFLLVQGANPNQLDGRERTPLMHIAAEGHCSLVELFISNGAVLDVSDIEGLTPLTHAIINGHCELTQLLLNEGADVNAIDCSGKSPLDLAVYQGSADMVDILLENGANMEKLDTKGVRPLDRVIGFGNAAVVTIFLKKGAKLGPATWIMATGKPEIQLILLNKLLEDGNTLYRKSLLVDAAHRYRYALKRLPKEEEDWSQTFSQLNTHLLLNLSRCERRLGHFHEAAHLASQAITFQSGCAEALVARAKANQAAGKFKEALFDFYNALGLRPESREIRRAIIKLKEEVGCENQLVKLPISFGSSESMIDKSGDETIEDVTKCNSTKS